jgi:hypothetical protein
MSKSGVSFLVTNTMGLLKSEMSEKFSKITNIGSKKLDERVELTTAPRPKVRFLLFKRFKYGSCVGFLIN